MIPLYDDIQSRTTPWVNYLVIAACTVVFLFQLMSDPSEASLIERFGMVPARLSDADEPVAIEYAEPVRTPRGIQHRPVRRELAPPAVPPTLTLLTCIFLHGGWLHFLGNMWFLHIFGDNVEDRLGHLGFAGVYLGTGVAAGLAHAFASPESPLPTVGASGAIAGVMGAYMLLYPRAVVLTLVPIFFFLHIVPLPAPVFLGVWFLLQLFQGVMAVGTGLATGVAWWAHIGGFAAGAAISLLLEAIGWERPPAGPRETRTGRVSWNSRSRGP